MKRCPRIEYLQDSAGKWRWHLKAANGRIQAQGEDHGSRRDARRAAAAVQQAFAVAAL